VRPGPGEAFVTLSFFTDEKERELAVPLERIVAVELAPAKEDGETFRHRRVDVGFGRRH
jgi:hypothetical protein